MVAPGPQPALQQTDFITNELERLGLKTSGSPEKTELTLPQELTGPDWSMKKTVCEQGGYDLSPYAGKTVVLTKYQTGKIYVRPGGTEADEEPLDVHVVTSGDKIACVYFAVVEGSTSAPGILPVNEQQSAVRKDCVCTESGVCTCN